MNDLVERLRESAKLWAREVETRLEAADEIERLRAQLDDINVADLIAQKGRDEALLRQARETLTALRYRALTDEPLDTILAALKERLK